VSEPPWRISYTPAAHRDLRRLDPQIRARVLLAIERAAGNDPRTDIRKLAGSDELRLRVGDWRVRFRREAGSREIVVLRVLPRGRAYER
jgi:mRNA interferase RelE/StbE